MKKKNVIIIGTIIIFIALCVCGIILTKDKPNDGNENNLEEIKAVEIETKYGKLYYPESYKNCLKTKIKEDNGYKVKFYGKIEGVGSKHLFDICFNSDDGDLLGYIDNDIKEKIVNLSVDVIELKFDKSWSDEDIDFIYSMQDERNFVINKLNKKPNYVEP